MIPLLRLIVLCVSLVAFDARADTVRSLSLDSAASKLAFDATTTFHAFDGHANRISGELTLTEGRPTVGRVVCNAAEIVTGSDGRDRDMHGPKYLDAGKYPDIVLTFESLQGDGVPDKGIAAGTLQGKLRVKDRVVDVAVPVTYGWKGDRLLVSGNFPLDIRRLGMEPPQVFVVQKMSPMIGISFTLLFKDAHQ